MRGLILAICCIVFAGLSLVDSFSCSLLELDGMRVFSILLLGYCFSISIFFSFVSVLI